jgi:hypothetical protein
MNPPAQTTKPARSRLARSASARFTGVRCVSRGLGAPGFWVRPRLTARVQSPEMWDMLSPCKGGGQGGATRYPANSRGRGEIPDSTGPPPTEDAELLLWPCRVLGSAPDSFRDTRPRRRAAAARPHYGQPAAKFVMSPGPNTRLYAWKFISELSAPGPPEGTSAPMYRGDCGTTN